MGMVMLTALPWLRPATGIFMRKLEVSMFSRTGSPTETSKSAFAVFAQLLAVISLREHGDIPEVERNRVGPIVAHGADQLAVAESVISGELDSADLDLGPFFDFENKNDGVAGGDALILRADFGELAAVFGEELLQDHLGFFYFCRIELAFDAQTDLAFLEAIENVRFGNGVDAVVTNAANLRAFLDFEKNDLAAGTAGRVFDAELHVLEELCVPQSLEIAAQRFFVVRIALAAEDARFQRVAADAAVAEKLDAVNDKLLRGSRLRIRRGTVLHDVLAGRVIKGSGEETGTRGGRRIRRAVFRGRAARGDRKEKHDRAKTQQSSRKNAERRTNSSLSG